MWGLDDLVRLYHRHARSAGDRASPDSASRGGRRESQGEARWVSCLAGVRKGLRGKSLSKSCFLFPNGGDRAPFERISVPLLEVHSKNDRLFGTGLTRLN